MKTTLLIPLFLLLYSFKANAQGDGITITNEKKSFIILGTDKVEILVKDYAGVSDTGNILVRGFIQKVANDSLVIQRLKPPPLFMRNNLSNYLYIDSILLIKVAINNIVYIEKDRILSDISKGVFFASLALLPVLGTRAYYSIEYNGYDLFNPQSLFIGVTATTTISAIVRYYSIRRFYFHSKRHKNWKLSEWKY